MSEALFPTKTRRHLLDDVAYDAVIQNEDQTWVLYEDGTRRKVTSSIAEVERAGWVVLPVGGVYWRLTELGERVLNGQEQQP